LIDGLYFEIKSQNSIKIKEFNKSLLNNLWKKDIVDKFFNGAQDPNMGQNFILAYEKLKNVYYQKSFYSIEPEMNESFNEWYKEKDIANVINNMKFLSDQVKANLEKEQQILKERTERERIEKDFHDAIEMQRENAEVLKKTISALEVSHANQLKDLGQKLDNANAAAQAAKEAAAAAQAQIAAMSKGKKKKWWKFW
jgi:microsomal dipeptidase-like Zn-dependent dipeptidase